MKKTTNYIKEVLRFIDFLRHRSLGLVMVLSGLIYTNHENRPLWIGISLVFLAHSYRIFKADKGVKNLDLLTKIESVESRLFESHKKIDSKLDLLISIND